MTEKRTRRITRRDFIGGVVVGGAGLLLGCAPGPERRLARVAGLAGPKRRRVWAFADSHVGLAGGGNDGRDGAEWLEVCLKDLEENVEPVDYAVGLGDLTHNAGPADELEAYARVRGRSHLPAWYELAGNHDYAAVPAGRWRKYVKRPPRYALIDGTLAWFFVSAEQGKSDGKVSRATAGWLKSAVARHQDKRNIIVCSHQAVWGTVSGSRASASCLNHRGLVRNVIKQVRIDLWLCGHIHAGRRHSGYVARGERTTYVNVASAGHAYSTGACNGYVLEMEEGSNTMLARCRDHDGHGYVKDQGLRLELPHPWRFFARPVVMPAPL